MRLSHGRRFDELRTPASEIRRFQYGSARGVCCDELEVPRRNGPTQPVHQIEVHAAPDRARGGEVGRLRDRIANAGRCQAAQVVVFLDEPSGIVNRRPTAIAVDIRVDLCGNKCGQEPAQTKSRTERSSTLFGCRGRHGSRRESWTSLAARQWSTSMTLFRSLPRVPFDRVRDRGCNGLRFV